MNINAKSQMGYYDADNCSLAEFASLASRTSVEEDITNASSVALNIPVYNVDSLEDRLSKTGPRRELMAEWARILQKGSGVFVLKGAQSDHMAIDDATQIYKQIIAAEKIENGGGADHFAAAGSNDRIWNSLQKLCESAPEIFIRYFASPAIDAVCEAWLGPNYQMTAQVNLVHPGGQAQKAHRDYHLGFQTAEISGAYPAHVHDLSPLMTLQGGIAHNDMPIESGPTKFLPFSQLYRPGYAAWRRDDFRAYFEENHVQVALEKGDAVFFSPALFHAAGENRSADNHRLVNLLQVSSAFGRAMETIDRVKMCKSVSDPLRNAMQTGALSDIQSRAVIAATAEGYSFPTNLDQDPPTDGLAPKSQQALLTEYVQSRQKKPEFIEQLEMQADRKNA